MVFRNGKIPFAPEHASSFRRTAPWGDLLGDASTVRRHVDQRLARSEGKDWIEPKIMEDGVFQALLGPLDYNLSLGLQALPGPEGPPEALPGPRAPPRPCGPCSISDDSVVIVPPGTLGPESPPGGPATATALLDSFPPASLMELPR
ncbi:unnamed protein product [Boreogadus saida]